MQFRNKHELDQDLMITQLNFILKQYLDLKLVNKKSIWHY